MLNKLNANKKNKKKDGQSTLNMFFKVKNKPTLESSSSFNSHFTEKTVSPPVKALRTQSVLSSLHSQGSFEEESNDDFYSLLREKKPVKNFKPSSQTFLSSSQFQCQSGSSFSSQTSTVSGYFSSTTATATATATESSWQKPKLERTLSGVKRTYSDVSDGSQSSSSSNALSLSSVKRVKPIPRQSIVSHTSSKSSKSSSINGRIELTAEQRKVIEYVCKDRLNVFYTGSAGTGKSVILRTMISTLNAKYGKDAVAVTASTGLAAVNIGGITINKFSGVGIGQGDANRLINMVKRNKTSLNRWKRTKVLIVDEISMIDGYFLDKLDAIGRGLLNRTKPFGGIQLVFTGDFFQLPPVPDRDSNKAGPIFCFESNVWKYAIHKTILLQQVFRQTDNELIDLLNGIRMGNTSGDTIKLIKKFEAPVEYDDGIEPTELYPTRREVELSNKRRLERLPGYEILYKAVDFIPPNINSNILNNVMAEKEIKLKEDAQVMMLKNIDDTLVNGSLGRVLFFCTSALFLEASKIFPDLSDPEVVQDMRCVCRAIGVPPSGRSSDLQRDINLRPTNRQEVLNFLLDKASKIVNGPGILSTIMFPVVKFIDKQDIRGYQIKLVEPEEFSVGETEKDSAVRKQLPLMLCWAISIHKSQGQTIDRLKVDLKRTFESGQVYVALSRAVSKDRLQITNFDPHKIKVNEKVKDFYQNLHKLKT